MNRRGIIAALASLPFVGVAAAHAKAWQTMLDAGVFASFPGKTFSKGPKTLWAIADEIMEALLPIHPEGFGPDKEYRVSVDEQTGNILVHNDVLGFAVTRHTIEEGFYIEAASGTFRKLKMAVAQYRRGEG